MTIHQAEVLHRVVTEADQKVLVLDSEIGKTQFHIGEITLPEHPDHFVRLTGYDATPVFVEANRTLPIEELVRKIIVQSEKNRTLTMTFHESRDWVMYSKM